MGVLIQGPWKKLDESKNVSESDKQELNVIKSFDPSTRDYPWYALTGPKGTTVEQHRKAVEQLKKIAKIAGQDGLILLSKGWYWDSDKMQVLIDNLMSIGKDSNEIPDDVA